MRPLSARLMIWLLCVSVVLCPLHAQQATVTHGVSLRGDPSTRNPTIETLHKGSTVTVLDPIPHHGFYHVRTSDGKEGWVGSKYIMVESAGVTPSGSPQGGTTPPAGSPQCDNSLWIHVYNPQRLIVKTKCIAVTGVTVDATNGNQPDGVRHEADGDTHGWLKLDPEFTSLLNAGNVSAEGGNMVFEIVCKFPVTQADARPACQSFNHPVTIPPVGSHVRVVGSYVQDTNHAKWMEIHPVTSITVVP